MLEMALKKCEPSLMQNHKHKRSQQYFELFISQKTKCIKKRVKKAAFTTLRLPAGLMDLNHGDDKLCA